jgi:hypothetical protein
LATPLAELWAAWAVNNKQCRINPAALVATWVAALAATWATHLPEALAEATVAWAVVDNPKTQWAALVAIWVDNLHLGLNLTCPVLIHTVDNPKTQWAALVAIWVDNLHLGLNLTCPVLIHTVDNPK